MSDLDLKLPAMPSKAEADEFLSKVDEVSRLLEGLKAGSIPPEYIDTKVHETKVRWLRSRSWVLEADPSSRPVDAQTGRRLTQASDPTVSRFYSIP